MKLKYNKKKPNHIAIIMDGNGRWAEKNKQLRINGHYAGTLAIQKTIKYAIKNKINSLTLYAFSKENWKRPKKEVSNLMKIFEFFLKNEIEKIKKYNIKLNIIGDINQFKNKLKKKIKQAILNTKKNTGLKLNIAINYSGKWDIVQSMQKIAKKIKNKKISIRNINENLINKFISLNDQPKVDLVIRTGKEYRISNFLLWQIAYSELYFTNVLWPDFNEKIFNKAISEFKKRKRRFGKI